MKDFLRHPERNALILGLLQGVPQGLMFEDHKQFVGGGFDNANLALLFCFGLFGPPLLAVFGHFANGRKSPTWWNAICEYVNPYHLVAWGALSLGLLGACSLRSNGASEGYAVCAFFIGGAAGFAGASFLDRWLKKRVNAT
jgi:hypothetical protein